MAVLPGQERRNRQATGGRTIRLAVALLAALTMLAAACSNDNDLFQQALDESEFGEATFNLDDLPDGLPNNLDGLDVDDDLANELLEQITGVDAEELQDNPFSLFCAESTPPSPPADWMFATPSAMNVLAYEIFGNDKQIRGTTEDLMTLVVSINNEVFPGSPYEVISDDPSGARVEFQTPMGLARLDGGMIGDIPCWNVSLRLLPGITGTDEAPAESVSESAVAAADDSGAATTAPAAPTTPEPEIVVAMGTTIYQLEPAVCQISFDSISVSAVGDATLAIDGNPSSASVSFAANDGTSIIEDGVEVIVPIPGALTIIFPNGTIITAVNC
ncbi:MAG: hypothetical protein AAF567_01285 [Actinomycetota bacterium]